MEKDKIDKQIKAPDELKNRIRQEITEFDNKKNKKTPLVKTMHGIAAVVVIGVLSVTSYAAVTGNLSLENLGLFKASKNYSQNAIEINQSIENKYIKFTLNNIACDDTYLITESTLNLTDTAIKDYGDIEYSSKYKQYSYPMEKSTYINNQEIYSWGIDIQKTADKEYKILELYNISDIKEKDFNFKLNIENIALKDENNSESSEVGTFSYESDGLYTPIKKIDVNKSVSMDIQRKESNKANFEEISQTVGNKTIVVKEAANTNFDTIIKASIITEENYSEYLKNEENNSDYNSFMLTQGNGDDRSYQVSEDLNTYFILNDGNMILASDLSEYMSNQNNQENLFVPIFNLGFNKESQAMDYNQIIEKYGYDTNLENKVVKIQKNYTIKIGNQENGNDVKNVKLLPIKKNYINDRNDEEYKYYKNATWYKLENKKYTATSELGGTLEITNIDITDDTITFYYNTKGLIGEDDLILMRKNNGEFNYFYPEKTEIKGLNSNENKLTFSRKNNQSSGTFGYNISQKDVSSLLNDISKDEFTMLFGKKNGTEFIGNGLIFDIPDKITDKISIKNIEITDLENIDLDNNTTKTNVNDNNNLFEEIQNENNTVDTDSNETNEQFTLKQYNEFLSQSKKSIENIEANGSKMDKNTASISGIKINSTIDQVHNIIKETPGDTFIGEDIFVEYYSDDIIVEYKKKNNTYYVTSISTHGRLKSDRNIKVGSTLQNVIENYAKNNKLVQIYKNSYNNGWVLYGNDDAVNLKDVEGYVINSAGGKNAYYLLNSYSDDYIEQDYARSSLLYFDDDVCMEYFIEDGIVSEITLSIHEDMSDY